MTHRAVRSLRCDPVDVVGRELCEHAEFAVLRAALAVGADTTNDPRLIRSPTHQRRASIAVTSAILKRPTSNEISKFMHTF